MANVKNTNPYLTLYLDYIMFGFVLVNYQYSLLNPIRMPNLGVVRIKSWQNPMSIQITFNRLIQGHKINIATIVEVELCIRSSFCFIEWIKHKRIEGTQI